MVMSYFGLMVVGIRCKCCVVYCVVTFKQDKFYTTTSLHFSLFNTLCKTTLPELSTNIHTPFTLYLKQP